MPARDEIEHQRASLPLEVLLFHAHFGSEGELETIVTFDQSKIQDHGRGPFLQTSRIRSRLDSEVALTKPVAFL